MTQLTVTPTIDSFMDFSNPTTNYGSNVSIALGVLFAGGSKTAVRRPIANFDVSAIPVDAEIDAAELRVTVTLADSDPFQAIVERCTRPTTWTELGVTWNRYDGVNNWTLGGGDYDLINEVPPAVPFDAANASGPFVIEGLSAFVRDALDNRSGIVSLIIHNADENPIVSHRNVWLSGAFWSLVTDYTEAAAAVPPPGRRSRLRTRDPRAARPAGVFRPAAPARPVRPRRPAP